MTCLRAHRPLFAVVVLLWTSTAYAHLTSHVDSRYDRHFLSKPSNAAAAEGIYYYGPALNQFGVQSLPTPTNALRTFNIPATALYKAFPWDDYPPSWDGIKINGVYIAIEVWGRGRVWIEFDRYETFST